LAKLLYPPMQAIDIHTLDVDIAHAGMDQRKIHMLVRDVFPKLGWKVPLSVHHKILPSLNEPKVEKETTPIDKELGITQTKMSKSDSKSGIFINDSDEVIKTKIKKAWCDQGDVLSSPLVDIVQSIILPKLKTIKIETRSEKLVFDNSNPFQNSVANNKIHPADLKDAVAASLIEIISPLREKLQLDDEIKNIIQKSV